MEKLTNGEIQACGEELIWVMNFMRNDVHVLNMSMHLWIALYKLEGSPYEELESLVKKLKVKKCLWSFFPINIIYLTYKDHEKFEGYDCNAWFDLIAKKGISPNCEIVKKLRGVEYN